LNNRKKDQSRA